ncbi:MAG: hypothetical protein P8P74_04880 [Crocinitomicaceae bacterium]|nr:hypothetical protein [Crocinitomicaceae bacterium]
MKEEFTNSLPWLALFVFFCGFSSVEAQTTVDSIQHNGKQYYVYPFRKKVKIHHDYWKLIDDDTFFEDYNNYFNRFNGDWDFTREAFQMAETEEYREELERELRDHWKWKLRGRGFGKAATRTLRKRPGELMDVSYNHGKDVLPPFGTIPDGKYVQLFEEFCLVDADGKCQSDGYQIAGYFTINNNVIDGEAVWLNFKGDTLKKGSFVEGLKVGEWEIKHPTEVPYKIRGRDRKRLKKGGSIWQDYAMGLTNFKNGLPDGTYRYESYGSTQQVRGEFKLGEPSGEWRYLTNSQLTLRMQMADPSDTVLSKKSLLRGAYMEQPRRYYRKEGDERVKHDMDCREAPMPAFPNSFYEIQFEKLDEELELTGENEKSFDLTDARRYDPHSYRGYRRGSDGDVMVVDPVTGVLYPRWHVMDSLGARMKYDGVYEQYYMNGQLFFRYEFENGQLKSEDTLFWDNGNPLDVIVFEPDSNKYYRSLYDRGGYLYDIMIYDSLGSFIEYYSSKPPRNYEVEIDGLIAEENGYGRRAYFNVQPVAFFYRDNDTLKSESLNSKVLLTRTWTRDTTIQTNIVYDAVSHEYISEKFNCFGDVHSRISRSFSDDFSGWTGKQESTYGDLTLRRKRSGIRYDVDEVDTLKHWSVRRAWNLYDVTSDVSLLKNEELFTGEFKMTSKGGQSRVKSKSNKVSVRHSSGYFGSNRYYRARRKDKKAKRFMLNSITNGLTFQGASSQVNSDFSEYFFRLVHDYNRFMNYNAHSAMFSVKSVEGNFLDGKAHGIWTAYDSKGDVVSSLNFNRGEADGELKFYNYQNKRPKYGYIFEDRSLDTFPKRRTRYLSQVINFKNGLREGKAVEYDWLGRVMTSGSFVNDEIDGKMISRNQEMHTEATFKEGYLDGYLKTYLTFPEMDSILLYDINLQNGMLNGESKSYHTNGKLAKRGFFLDGEPIEDYEAYDTLGFKFHYVKFQYGMPVEEKIWEENALSIRYQFNWEDSIEFHPDDITSTMSLEALLAKEGYRTYSVQEKYYGRTALIAKDDIECRMTKYYPNDTVARDGQLLNKQKTGLWKFYSYNGQFLYEANYFDSIIVINDSVKFKSKGILTDYDDAGNRLYNAYIIEKFEKYDCAHTDHYEIRQLITIDEENDSTGRMNGHVLNYYDNGTLQSQGTMKDGIPDGLWKFYDPFGKLNKMGNYTFGKRHGRWLEGDLEKKKYLGEICMNPNLPNIEEQQEYQENLLDITIINYVMGKLKNTQYYDLDMNRVMEIEESKNN